MKITDKHIFFYTEWPSNFRKTSFEFEGFGEKHNFFCTEQAFMWCKAMYFNDIIIAEKILEEKSDPMVCKNLGRLVRGYNDDKWKLVRYSFMLEVNFARFTQDKNLKENSLIQNMMVRHLSKQAQLIESGELALEKMIQT